MAIRISFFFTFFLCLLKIHGQSQITTDILGSSYLIDNQEIIKTDNINKYKYKNILLGKISNLDINNPLQTLVFYKQQNTIVILDKNLTEINQIDLNKTNSNMQAIYAGLAIKNNVWIMDIISKKVGLLGLNDRILNFITTTIDSEIIWISSNLNNLYFLNNLNELYEVDIYGKINFIVKLDPNQSLKFEKNIFETIDVETNNYINRFEVHKGNLKKLK